MTLGHTAVYDWYLKHRLGKQKERSNEASSVVDADHNARVSAERHCKRHPVTDSQTNWLSKCSSG